MQFRCLSMILILSYCKGCENFVTFLILKYLPLYQKSKTNIKLWNNLNGLDDSVLQILKLWGRDMKGIQF
jgi:hypothetical protein